MNTEDKNVNTEMNPDNMPLTWVAFQGTPEQRAWAQAQLEREKQAQAALEAERQHEWEERRQKQRALEAEMEAKYREELIGLADDDDAMVRAIMTAGRDNILHAWQPARPPAEAVAAYRTTRRAARRDLLARSCGVPELHLVHVYDVDPVETDAIHAVRKWLASDKRILVLSGGCDAGKSGAAAWACCQTPGAYVTADKLRHTFGLDDDAARMRKRLEEVELLVVDDLGAEYADAKGFSASGIGSLISSRYDSRRRTIVTTNIDFDAFKAQHPRVYQRIKETGTWYDCKTVGFRNPKK